MKKPEIETYFLKKMKDLVKKTNKPMLDVDKGEAGVSGYRDDYTKEEVYEQTYSITWLEIE